jgi:hypothetical protein
MKRILLILIAVFEIIYGLFGLVLVVGGLTGRLPYAVVSALWFGIFPLISLLAGVLLLLRWKHAVILSILVQLLQVPFIYTDGFMLNLGLPSNLTVTGIWNSRTGGNPTVLGINFLALGVLILLLWCRSALVGESYFDAASNNSLDASGISLDVTDKLDANRS